MGSKTFIILTAIATLTLFSFPVSANQSPYGWLDGATCDIIGGWAGDMDTPDDTIAIHFYIHYRFRHLAEVFN